MSSAERENLETRVNGEVRRFIAGAILFNLKVADEVGLNATDVQCLNLLELRGGATPGELARWAYLTTGGVTVVLDRMEKAGYIRRDPNPNDRRSSIVRPIAARARQLHARYRAKGQELARALGAYSEPELRLILDFLQRANSGRVEAKQP
jgi:DNA-binding MarR family transcriptional regulator